MTIRIMIFQPLDPLGNKIGGTGTFIRNFIENAPDEFAIELVGISSNKKERPVGKWQEIKLGNKEFNFLPVLYISDENKRTKLPLISYFAFNLLINRSKIRTDDKILEYCRIEPELIFKNVPNKKILYILGNVRDLYNPHSDIIWSKLPWAYFKLEKSLVSRMDRVLVVSKNCLEFYKKQYSFMSDRFSFIHTFVNDKKFYPYSSDKEKVKKSLDFKKKYGFAKKDKIILFVGRLERVKNPFLLINTFNNLVKRNINIKLLVVGTGSLEEGMLERVKKYDLQDSIKFVGVVPLDDITELMRSSDVFLMTSAFEGMPISVLEALASGLPVVSTDVGEVKMVVKNGESGLLVKSNNVKDIAEAVLDILKNKEKFDSKKCVDSIKDYTVEHVLDRIYKMHYDIVV